MAYDLSTVSSERVIRPPRIVLLGVEKIGKSTFAGGSNNPIFISIKGEEGIDDIPVAKTPVCNAAKEIFGWLRSLYEDEHNYETGVIDSSSTLEKLFNAEICAKSGASSINEGSLAFGTGADQALIMWETLTQWIDALRLKKNMAFILIGHVKIKRFDDPNGESFDQYQWDIHQKAANLLTRWADSILFANTKVIVQHEKLGFHKDNVKKRGIEIVPGRRFLYTQKRPAHPGGGRGAYGRLPYELPLEWEHFQNVVSAAMQVNQISPQSEEATNE
ncbi:hypothetical protein LCGC14_2781270 [marine sediment metagenome]|uniref:Uncharacterized protein n=1 Tax=marine sediment metagenome TaxID=412755 RepID=A0A0F8ZFB7_9ZZZZ